MDLVSVEAAPPAAHIHSYLQFAPYIRPTPNEDQQIFKNQNHFLRSQCNKISSQPEELWKLKKCVEIEPHAHSKSVNLLSTVTESATQSN